MQYISSFKSRFVLCLCLISIQSFHLSAQEPTKEVLEKEMAAFRDLKNTRFNFIPHTNEIGAFEGERRFMWQFPSEFSPAEFQGVRHTPSSRIVHIARTQNKISYDVVYTFDQYGRRVTATPKKKSVERFVVLGGCSFTYGNGLNDVDTINNYIAQLSDKVYPYNYAVGATGMNVLLSMIIHTKFSEQIPEKEGDFVYIYIPAHVQRALGYWPSLAFSKRNPYFEEDENGHLVQNGSFETGRSFLTKLIETVALLLPQKFLANRDFPRIFDFAFNRACKMVVEAKEQWQKQYPESRFLTYFHPMGGEDEKMEKCLKENNVDTLVGKEFTFPYEEATVPLDGHPNGKANKVIAAEILNWLMQNEKKVTI